MPAVTDVGSRAIAVAGCSSYALALLVRSTSRVALLEAGDLASPSIVSSFPRLDEWILALALGLVTGWMVSKLRPQLSFRDVSPLFFPALALTALVPGIFTIMPFTAAFAGRLLDLILIGSAIACLLRWLPRRWTPVRFGTANRVALIAFGLYLALGAKLQAEVGLSGDEPHYLLIAHSLLEDGDLAVQNNYANQDFARFYRGKIGPHLAQGSSYSVHGVGLPILLFPGFALLGLSGVLLIEAILGAATVREVYRACWTVTEDRLAALIAASAFGLTAPALFLSVSAYPELPAALLTITVFRRLTRDEPPGGGSSLLWGAVLLLAPFLHVKFVPLSFLLAGAMAYRYRSSRRSTRLFALGAALSIVLFLAFSWRVSGSLDPTAGYGRPRLSLGAIPLGLAGLLFDQEFGLLPASPIYLIGLIGILSLYRRRPFLGGFAGLVLAAVALPGAAHPLWSGGSSPPARFLFPALPLVAVAAGTVFSFQPKRGLEPWARGLLLASFCLGAAMALLPDQPLYLNGRDGTGRIWEALSSSWDLTVYLPSIVGGEAPARWWALICGLGLAACFAIQASGRRLALPPLALLLMALVWLQDGFRQPGFAPAPGWLASFLAEAPGEGERGRGYLSQPGSHLFEPDELLPRIPFPLASEPRDDDVQFWHSRSLILPAGRYRLDGPRSDGLALRNGEGCFEISEPGFQSEVTLRAFHLRAPGPQTGITLRVESLGASDDLRLDAYRTFATEGGLRLHGLDQSSYLDERGFWTRGASRALFALEGDCGGPCRLRIANGGLANWVVIQTQHDEHRFALRAWQERLVDLAGAGPVRVFSLTSDTSFRPVDLDPGDPDRRELGIFVSAFD